MPKEKVTNMDHEAALRDMAKMGSDWLREAADEIDRLKAENDALRKSGLPDGFPWDEGARNYLQSFLWNGYAHTKSDQDYSDEVTALCLWIEYCGNKPIEE